MSEIPGDLKFLKSHEWARIEDNGQVTIGISDHAQGLLGGLTVKLMLPLIVSAAHATLAQLFFCTTGSLAVFTSRSWMSASAELEEERGFPVRYLCLSAAATIFLQLILGAASLGHVGQATTH